MCVCVCVCVFVFVQRSTLSGHSESPLSMIAPKY